MTTTRAAKAEMPGDATSTMPAGRHRHGTKSALLRQNLERAEGASLEEICAATGWQAHSARAALSGLRKAGYTIERSQSEKPGGTSRYRITAAPVAKA